jgi:colicin import membrane protein
MLAIEARESRNAVSAALLMHGLLAAALLFSLQWKDRTPIVQAELWSAMPRDIPATPTPPAPVVRSTPPAPPAPVPETKADIALKKKEEPKKEEPKKLEPPKVDVLKAQQEAQKKALEKKLAEKKAAEQLEAQRRAELARLGIDPNAKPGAAGRDAATKTGVIAGGAEVGSKTGRDADYESLIQARIKARINYPDRSAANPEAIVQVDQLPTGEVVAVKLVRASGTPAWDEAVQRAVWAASPLPKRKDGTVARVLELAFRPKEDR